MATTLLSPKNVEAFYSDDRKRNRAFLDTLRIVHREGDDFGFTGRHRRDTDKNKVIIDVTEALEKIMTTK